MIENANKVKSTKTIASQSLHRAKNMLGEMSSAGAKIDEKCKTEMKNYCLSHTAALLVAATLAKINFISNFKTAT